MATIRWLGTDDAVQQVTAGAIASLDATPGNNTFTITIGGVAVSVAGVTNVATTAAALVAAATASTHPYFQAVTWAVPSAANITGTAKTAGIPFTATLTKTGAGTGTVTAFSDTTANAGPNVVSAANFSGGALPSNGDTLIIEKNAVPILWNLTALAAVTFAEIRVPMDFTGLGGLDETQFCTAVTGTEQTYSTTRKPEYRPCYLQVKTTTAFNYGQGNGAGAARFKIDFQSWQFSGFVFNTCTTSKDPNLQPLRILGSHASNALTVFAGTVGVATSVGNETATIATLNEEGGDVTFSQGVGWTTIAKSGGTLRINSAGGSSAISNVGGPLYVHFTGTIGEIATRGTGVTTITGTGEVDALKVFGPGRVLHNGSGNVIGGIVDNGGIVDFTGSEAFRTAALVIYSGGGTVAHNPTAVALTLTYGTILFPVKRILQPVA